jgi:hypothetical protein
MAAPMKRLLDLPGIAELETKALMKPDYAQPEARAEFPEIDEISRALFGLTADEAEAVETPSDWKKPMSALQQLEAFEAEGWDVTDNRRRPLRMLPQFSLQLLLAIRGVAGSLPFIPEDDGPPDPWGAGMAADAKRFRKR